MQARGLSRIRLILIGMTVLFVGLVSSLVTLVSRAEQSASLKRIVARYWSGKDYSGNVVGFINNNPYSKTLDLALRMHPGTEQMFIVSGTLTHDKKFENACRRELVDYECRVSINYLTDLSPAELTAKVKSVPERSIILYIWQQAKDEQSRLLQTPDVIALVANSASVPIYGVASWQVGKGIVGGYLRDTETIGARAADVALRIANGNRAQNIPIESVPVIPMFDWRELKRWGISETSLPPGSVVRFRMPSFWDEYKWYVIAAISLIVFQSALIVGLVINRTRGKRAEKAMRESEERFRNMADTAPVMIWVSNPNKLCTYVNKQWLDFTGRSIKDELGNGWTECIDPDDYDRCLQTYNNACDHREPFAIEYRLRRADGESRLVLDSGIPRLSPSGEFLGYIGYAIDITERKAAEQALRDLSGQLIHAREDECARIARELHDDLNQRVALVSLELDHLSQNPPQSKAELRELIRQIINQAADLSTEIHRMSHDLHPSKLVQLGLVAALKSLCSELSASYGLSIELNCVDVPAALPKDVSICLYRIVQESLNNVVRHSGAEEAEVELRGTGQQVTLRVEDTGRGFEIESARSNKGLGLMSMRERLRLVGGTMTIETGMWKGTRIEVRVPLGQEGVRTEPLTGAGKGQASAHELVKAASS